MRLAERLIDQYLDEGSDPEKNMEAEFKKLQKMSGDNLLDYVGKLNGFKVMKGSIKLPDGSTIVYRMKTKKEQDVANSNIRTHTLHQLFVDKVDSYFGSLASLRKKHGEL
jgi:hypothetical protein